MGQSRLLANTFMITGHCVHEKGKTGKEGVRGGGGGEGVAEGENVLHGPKLYMMNPRL